MNYGAPLVRDDLRDFAAALDQLLTTRGMSGEDLADAVGVSASTVSSWRRGKARPEAANVEAVEDALSVPSGHLARHLGYLPVSQGPQAESIGEFLKREGLLTDEQQLVLIQVHAQFLRVRPLRTGRRHPGQ